MAGSKRKSRAISESKPGSRHEELFLELWRLFNRDEFDDPTPQHRFDPTRRWRLDFAWLKERVAVEIDGAIWIKGAHSSGAGTERDREKSNALTLQNWALLRYSTTTLERDPERVIEEIKGLLRMRADKRPF